MRLQTIDLTPSLSCVQQGIPGSSKVIIAAIVGILFLRATQKDFTSVGNRFDNRTTHRGFTHSIFFAAVSAGILYFILESQLIILTQASQNEVTAISFVLSLGLFTGVLLHLADDEIL